MSQSQSNTLLPAMEVLIREGMHQDSPMKIRKALQEVRRDSRRFGWSDDTIESLPNEWQWRISTARIQLGILDWRGWQWRNPRDGHDPFKIPKWRLGLPIYPIETECKEPERVKSLLIYSEQGVGDHIMLAQSFKYALPYADEITIEVEPRFEGLFKRSFPEFKIQALRDIRDASWVKEGQFDAKVLYGDVAARFLRSPDKFEKEPYIKPDPEKVKYWREWLEQFPKPWIGVSWAGRQGYIEPKLLHGINLQYGDYDVPDHLETPPINLKEDIEDVFGIVANLDHVVCVPNTLAHIAGVMGVPCEVIMTPGKGEVNNAVNFRWGTPDKRTMLWHPSIRVYRNENQWKHETNLTHN